MSLHPCLTKEVVTNIDVAQFIISLSKTAEFVLKHNPTQTDIKSSIENYQAIALKLTNNLPLSPSDISEIKQSLENQIFIVKAGHFNENITGIENYLNQFNS
jgi:hypothetical protein